MGIQYLGQRIIICRGLIIIRWGSLIIRKMKEKENTGSYEFNTKVEMPGIVEVGLIIRKAN